MNGPRRRQPAPGKTGDESGRRPLNPDRIRRKDSCPVTGAFLAYLVEKYDKGIVGRLNAACRRSAYKPEMFKESTGKDLDTLWEEFRQSLRK